jgi:DNA-binding transcriptional ArsR family regulator
MLVLGLRGQDVAAVRFAIAPLNEVVGSLIRRGRRGLNPATSPWEAQIDALLEDQDTTLLDMLVSPRGWAPDVLTPFPEGPEALVGDELDAVRGADPRRLRADFEAAYAGKPLPDPLRRRLRRPARLLEDIAVTLERYWELALEPRWPRIRATVEADISARTHRLARAGLGAMLADLQPQIGWDGRSLQVAVAPEIDHTIDLAGRSLPLVPSVFARHPHINLSADLPPVLVYAARGAALVWDDAGSPPPAALARLVGRGRAGVLMALSSPRATIDLAAALGVTPGAVSQHLQVLEGGRLVTRARAGRRVLYRRTELGDRLASATGDRTPPDGSTGRSV